MDRAVVPDSSALAFVSAGQLLEPTSPAVDGSETFLGPQLHPAGFIGMAAPDAAQEAGEIGRPAILVLAVTLLLFSAAGLLNNASLPSNCGPAGNACFTV